MKKITRSAGGGLSAESRCMSVERGACQKEKEKEREELMAIISPEDRQTLQTLFAQELQDDVNITYFTQRESVLIVPSQECSSCKETRELLEEVAQTSDKLHLPVKDFVRDAQHAQNLVVTGIPAFILQGHAIGALRYFGISSVFHFSTFVEQRIDISNSTTIQML